MMIIFVNQIFIIALPIQQVFPKKNIWHNALLWSPFSAESDQFAKFVKVQYRFGYTIRKAIEVTIGLLQKCTLSSLMHLRYVPFKITVLYKTFITNITRQLLNSIEIILTFFLFSV